MFNSCAGCHDIPYAGGGGDIATNVFVLAQRFDFAAFDEPGRVRTKSSTDERGRRVTLDTVGNSRMTVGLFGAGFVEMLARQMTADLQAIRNAMPPSCSKELVSKGVRLGLLVRREDGSWDTDHVEGLPAVSLATHGPPDPPSLVKASRQKQSAHKQYSVADFQTGDCFSACLTASVPVDLSPAAFNKHPAIAPVSPSRSHPHRARTRRKVPAARDPDIGVPIPTVIAHNPDMPGARSDRTSLHNRDRWPDSYHYFLRLGGTYPQAHSQQRSQN